MLKFAVVNGICVSKLGKIYKRSHVFMTVNIVFALFSIFNVVHRFVALIHKLLHLLQLFLLCSVRATIERYKKASAASTNAESVSEVNTQVNL